MPSRPSMSASGKEDIPTVECAAAYVRMSKVPLPHELQGEHHHERRGKRELREERQLIAENPRHMVEQLEIADDGVGRFGVTPPLEIHQIDSFDYAIAVHLHQDVTIPLTGGDSAKKPSRFGFIRGVTGLMSLGGFARQTGTILGRWPEPDALSGATCMASKPDCGPHTERRRSCDLLPCDSA